MGMDGSKRRARIWGLPNPTGGDRYEEVTGHWDGSWGRFRTCAPCEAIRRDYCPHGYLYGGLVETLLECLGYDYRVGPDKDGVMR